MAILVFFAAITTAAAFILLGLLRTLKVQSDPLQEEFKKGKVPLELPLGIYKGTVNFKTNWQGKVFLTGFRGVNNFLENGKQVQKYPFKFYKGMGISDKNLEVIKIDYNVPENPFWLKFILDEIVETSPDKYLGKVHIKLFPDLAFSMGYFQLEK